ncbi:hypothetical protein B1218_34915, partial [Pseudomonas ogarae]
MWGDGGQGVGGGCGEGGGGAGGGWLGRRGRTGGGYGVGGAGKDLGGGRGDAGGGGCGSKSLPVAEALQRRSAGGEGKRGEVGIRPECEHVWDGPYDEGRGAD